MCAVSFDSYIFMRRHVQLPSVSFSRFKTYTYKQQYHSFTCLRASTSNKHFSELFIGLWLLISLLCCFRFICLPSESPYVSGHRKSILTLQLDVIPLMGSRDWTLRCPRLLGLGYSILPALVTRVRCQINAKELHLAKVTGEGKIDKELRKCIKTKLFLTVSLQVKMIYIIHSQINQDW